MEFIKETDNKGKTYIIEGEKKPNSVFSVERFICEIQKQETEEETQQIADLVLKSLKRNESIQGVARKIYNDFNLDVEFSGNFELFFGEYFS